MLSHDSLKIEPNFVAPQIHQSHVASQTRLERNKYQLNLFRKLRTHRLGVSTPYIKTRHEIETKYITERWVDEKVLEDIVTSV